MAPDRDCLVYKAKLADQTDRYEDMVVAMKALAGMNQELDVEERNLLAVAYKNLVGARRYSWKIVTAQERKPDLTPKNQEINAEYKKNIEKELKDLCDEVLKLLDEKLLVKTSDVEAKVFYLKMKGDYCRYLAEVASGDAKSKVAEKGITAYEAATELAKSLPTTHSVRLGLALNFSVFYYEIMDNQDMACKIAKQAFDDGVAELDTLNEESFRDSTMIMQLLRDNLTIWHSEVPSQEDETDSEQVDPLSPRPRS